MTPGDLDQLLSVLRKHRVSKYEDQNITLTLGPLAFTPEAESADPTKIGWEHGNPTHEELLFASSVPVTSDELKG